MTIRNKAIFLLCKFFTKLFYIRIKESYLPLIIDIKYNQSTALFNNSSLLSYAFKNDKKIVAEFYQIAIPSGKFVKLMSIKRH